MSVASAPVSSTSPGGRSCGTQDASKDAFLAGRAHVLQPRNGHRSGLDTVLLAASVPASVGGHVMELGCGAGVAGFCLAARRPDLTVAGFDIDPHLIELAERSCRLVENAALAARLSFRVADVTAVAQARRAAGLAPGEADAVILNPPFAMMGSGRASPNPLRRRARVLSERGLEPWIRTAADVLKPGGIICLVFCASGLKMILDGLEQRFGGIEIVPFLPRQGASARRVLVRAHKGCRAPLVLRSGFVLHQSPQHAWSKNAARLLVVASLDETLTEHM